MEHAMCNCSCRKGIEHALLTRLLHHSCCASAEQAIDICTCVVMQAFAAAVQSILRSQTSALNQLPAAVKQRRQGEHTGHGKSSDNAGAETCHLLPMTVLEVVLHTQRLQVTLT